MAEIDNTSLTRTDLGLLEQKILSNQATANDYDRVDKFLNALGLSSYILNKIKEYNMNSYEEYILSLNNSNSNLTYSANIKGAALGAISALKTLKNIV